MPQQSVTHPKPPIGVCCIRDPRDSKVWSRTPHTICNLLESRGRLGPSIFGLPHAGKFMQLRAALTALRYGRPRMVRRFLHGRSMRRAHARHMVAQMAASPVKHFLHFAGDRYLPLPQKPAGTFHFLMLDSTWDYWRDPDMPPAYLDAVDADIRRGYHQMDHFFSLNDHARQSLIHHYGISPERISIVGSGRGAIHPYSGPKNYPNGAILFVAKERFRDKGGQLLLEGFRLARTKNPALQLWLVGDPELKTLAAGEPGVTVHGFLPLPELQALFEQASLFAMPAAREPWGLVYLEALTCKTPVLGLARGAIPDITCNGRFGFAVKDPTPAAIAATLLDAFSHLPRLADMGTQGQAHTLDLYTWEKTVDHILNGIDHVSTTSPSLQSTHP